LAQVIDLHMHSTRSDGTDSPTKIAQLAIAAGLSAASLTDHDTIDGFAEFAAGLEGSGVDAICGCEISCKDPRTGSSIHVLCYFIPEGVSPFSIMLDAMKLKRAGRNHALLEKLQELGYTKLSQTAIEHLAEKPLDQAGRPHFAQALIEAYSANKPAEVAADLPGYFTDTSQVFSALLGEGKAAYIPKATTTPAEATQAARASGAITVLAHPVISYCPWDVNNPLTIDEQRILLEPALADAKAAGIVGAEAYYSRHTPEQTALMLELCDRYGLIATGGSDYHGSNKPDLSLGYGVTAKRGTSSQLNVPNDVIEALRSAASGQAL
jgi:3',5'-nucleoside bisphosphate phosphatase